MNDFFNQKGNVRIILGKGYISLYEASNLKEGDVIKVSRYAGQSSLLYFNNEFLCYGDIIVLSDYFGFRVTKFDSEPVRESAGIKDHIVEVLPAEIQLDSIQFSLNELRGITVDSIIGLEKKYDKEKNVELIAAGIHLAAGKLVIIRENLGIKITEIYNQNKLKVGIRTSDFKVNEDLINFPIKDYDFRQPDKFTWETFVRVKEIHKLFIENLKLAIPDIKNINILSSDQMTFDEIFDHIKGEEYSYIVIDADVIHPVDFLNTVLHQYEPSSCNDTDIKYLLFKENSKNPASKDKDLENQARNMFLKILSSRKMLIVYPQSSPFSKIKDEASINEMILSPLRNSWKSITGINFKLNKRTSEFNEIKIVSLKDMILMLDIGEENNPGSRFTIVYPYITLEPIIGLLS
jgi:flagellar motor switch/type III secretory pathway protein FliN